MKVNGAKSTFRFADKYHGRKKKEPVQLNGNQVDGNVLSTSWSNISDYYIEELSIITKINK